MALVDQQGEPLSALGRDQAECFVHLDDDQMCKFFVEVHRLVEQFPNFDNQWWYLGGHLRNCECSNEGTREMLRNIVRCMETSTHGRQETFREYVNSVALECAQASAAVRREHK